MATVQGVKNNIKAKLDTLVPASLAEAVIQDLKIDPLNQEYAAFPVAVVVPPSLEGSEVLDNRSNLREYLFSVVVLMKPENFSSTSEVENLQEVILNAFDNDPTLGGEADGGMAPSYSRPYPLNYGGKDLVYFEIYLKIKVRKDLNFA